MSTRNRQVGTYFDTDYPYRASITVDGSNTSGGPWTAEVELPSAWSEFWDNVADTTNGYDIIVVDPETNGLANFQLTSFNYAGLGCTIQIEDGAVVDQTEHFHLYWGKASATDLSTSFTASSPVKLGWVSLDAPAAGDLVVVAGADVDADTPPVELVKNSAEGVSIWVDWRPMLRQRRRAYNRSRGYEAIAYADYNVTDGDPPSSVSSMVLKTGMAITVEGLVAYPIQAGADGSNYTAVLQVVTTLGRTLEQRVLVKVRDPLDA